MCNSAARKSLRMPASVSQVVRDVRTVVWVDIVDTEASDRGGRVNKVQLPPRRVQTSDRTISTAVAAVDSAAARISYRR